MSDDIEEVFLTVVGPKGEKAVLVQHEESGEESWLPWSQVDSCETSDGELLEELWELRKDMDIRVEVPAWLARKLEEGE